MQATLRLIAPLLVAPALALQDEAPDTAPTGDRPLTLQDFAPDAERIRFRDRPPAWSWAWDGRHLQLGEGEESRWLDPETLVEVDPRPEPESEPADPPPAEDRSSWIAPLEALGMDARAAERVAERASDDGPGRLARTRAGAFWIVPGDPVRVGRLDDAELLERSPDGARLAYVAGNDLHLFDFATGADRAVTANGSEERFNGKLDWVYQEELYGRGNFKAYWWSPDSAHVAFLSLDEEPVRPFTLVDHVEDGHFRVRPEVTNYPKAGDPNPIVSLGIVPADGADVVWADLTRYGEQEILITRVTWDPDGARCLIVVQDRIQTWAHLLAVDPASGELTPLIEERSESWTSRPDAPRWLRDGTFLWRSTRTGHAHLYRYRADGELVGPVTQGPWEVRRIRDIDEDAGTILFSASEGGAVDQHWYRTNLDGTGFRRLTQDRGSHSIDFREDGAFFLDQVSSLERPTEVRLCRGEDGAMLRVLGIATVPMAATHRMGAWELHEVPARDGFPLDVAVLKPVPFDPSRPHPVWISTYSGPNAPSVRNRWNSSAWFQFLAQQGVVVMQCNVRSASGKGHAITSAAYRDLGTSELHDMEDAVDWLCAHDWADGRRVGITGYSYGGFLTATCLTRSDRFRLGIAGGGVYDWRLYDTIYTERYMSTPQLNPEGYEHSSCLTHAGTLHGFLHMHHGLMDDNVHVQNLHHMADALMRAGRTNWSMMTYANTRHGIRDPELAWHARRTEWELIRKHLQPPGPPGGGEAAAAEFDAALGGQGDGGER